MREQEEKNNNQKNKDKDQEGSGIQDEDNQLDKDKEEEQNISSNNSTIKYEIIHKYKLCSPSKGAEEKVFKLISKSK